MVTPLLRIEDCRKVFPNGTVALDGVDLKAEAGRVHGLLGANGAGKSTLIKILSGAIPATGGEIIWRGSPVRLSGPAAAKQAGIATIYQHIPLAPTLSVLENILLDGSGWFRCRTGDRRRIATLMERTGIRLDLDALVADLSIGERQMVAIFQALAAGADLLVMDEPTASLSAPERETVYRIVRHVAEAEAKAVLFVSHFLDEIIALTDEVTVLRDGRVVLQADTRSLDEDALAAAIAGREVIALVRDRERLPTDARVALQVDALASPGKLSPTSFCVHAGEVVGLAGMLGSGRSELLHAIFGDDPDATGTVTLDGRSVSRSPGEAVAVGVALVPEDRAAQGFVPQMPLWQNITLPHLEQRSTFGLFPRTVEERAEAQRAIRRLSIRASGPDALPSELSGGNAQKMTIAKWLTPYTKLLLLDEPTAGIDIAARTEILKLIRSLAAGGLPVIIASSEYEDLLAICDRILVLRDGALVADRPAAGLDEHSLILLTGGSPPVHSPVPEASPTP